MDAQLDGLSMDSQFLLSYGAAHTLSLAALRWHGYRSDNRYLVFQCLQHTVGFSNAQWRFLDKCHQKGIILGLHSLLFQTKVKAAAAIMSYNFALSASDSLRSPTGSAGQAA